MKRTLSCHGSEDLTFIDIVCARSYTWCRPSRASDTHAPSPRGGTPRMGLSVRDGMTKVGAD